MIMTRHLVLTLALIALGGDSPAATVITADVCVYGGTSGGVAAALQTSRMGKTAVIVAPGRHLGGMTSGGLSAVDIGDPRTVGGIAREYFTRLVARYGKTLDWDKPFRSTAGGPATGGAYSIEPHVAEQVFNELVREANVTVHLDGRLTAVNNDGARIREIATEDGTVIRAAMFIDATYEGDLMAKAGVSYTLMREGNAQYGERHNGIHYDAKYQPRTNHLRPGANGRVKGGQGVWDRDFPLDPYVVPGDRSSGLLPLVQAGVPGVIGAPAPGVQAYCFRLCLTTDDDRLPIAPPPGYDPKRYEIVARFIDACRAIGDDMDLRWFSKYDPLPNGKWDFNTATFGGNLPGASWEWPEATYARRSRIAKEHEDYHRGLLHFLATDPRVPAKVRAEMTRFGLPRDEFTDNFGWPHQLYIREARRMVSDLVMTEHHTFGREVAPGSVGLGSYGTDTHEVRRIVKDGVVTREGKTAGGRDGAPPYPIGYAAIVPKPGECANLFVTYALSASHTAFSSIRMEPVFMVTSQSAGAAACLAIDDAVPVQGVDYRKLEARLLEAGQVLRVQASTKSRTEAGAAAAVVDPAAFAAISPLATKGTKPSPPAPRPAEPVQLARDAEPAQVDAKAYDLIVVGGTGSGVMCAVRAAREGCSVLLVQHNRHIGGMMSNGLMQFDALYGGPRAPLFLELLRNIEAHYIRTYGKNSPDHQTIRYTHEHYPVGWAEPHVAEREFNRLVAGEKRLTLLLSHYPTAVDRDGAMLRGVTLRRYGGTQEIHVRAAMFADATYEGDLLALAKVPYRVGREARDEYGEPHAGVVFGNIETHLAPSDAVEGRLNIRPYHSRQGSIDPTSPFTADGAVQAYNHRFCVTKDPANRILATSPPPGYDREEYVHFERKSIATNAGPNQKSHMNSPILPGENHGYPEGDWPTRERIIERHKNFGLGLMWFLQNDESVPAKQRQGFRAWGLAKDEFPDHDHVPYETYVREARRLVGRHVYTEHDNAPAPGLGRTPIFTDSIAITDWYMDSHACTTGSRPGYHYDGKLILTEESRPGQIPYRALLPKGVDNLLVPVCLSATHVAWGAVRLEPVWMETGEVAGVAAARALKEKRPPAQLAPDGLVRELCARRFLVSFFNDMNVGGSEPWIPAVQYLATRGFFPTYDARPGAPLTAGVARAWAEAASQLAAGTLDPMPLARRLFAMEAEPNARPVSLGEFAALLPAGLREQFRKLGTPNEAPLTRGEACRLLDVALVGMQ